MDFSRIKSIYMIGIKGVGMTMLAQYLRGKGYEVSGSDVADKFMTDEVLADSGIKVYEGFDVSNVPSDADLFVYSSSYDEKTNKEVAQVLNGNTMVLSYAECLGKIFNGQHGIAVVGSHGKTTTSAWLGYVLEKAGISPSVMVGAKVPQFDGASLIGKSEYLVAEVDEYQNKLQYFEPRAALLNNIDYDHPDYFLNESDYFSVFIDFVKKINKKGFLVANFDDKKVKEIAEVYCRGRVVSYAINEVADYVAYGIKNQDGKQYFKVKLGNDDHDDMSNVDLGDFSISLSGRHNILNALAVIATCVELEVDLMKIRRYLEDFTGTARRMQVMGKFHGATVLDDYAHHPTEIQATLRGVRDLYPENKLIVAFHPHTFTRTKFLLNEFAVSFGGVDELLVLDIYGSAREEQGGIHSKDLIEKIKESGFNGEIVYTASLSDCENYLRENVERNDVVLLMGAGDIFRVGENLVK